MIFLHSLHKQRVIAIVLQCRWEIGCQLLTERCINPQLSIMVLNINLYGIVRDFIHLFLFLVHNSSYIVLKLIFNKVQLLSVLEPPGGVTPLSQYVTKTPTNKRNQFFGFPIASAISHPPSSFCNAKILSKL